MAQVRVVAAVVDTRQLTLYKEDGKTVLIPQGDPRLRKILDQVTPICSQGGIATVNISDINVYKDFEEQTGGLTRFFRVAKNKVASFFGAGKHEESDTVAPTTVGQLPALSTAIDDIMAHATPAANDDSALKENETMVAVVGSGKGAKVIPGMENMKDQFHHALKLGSTKGVENFLRRISAVIDERQHSVHDLLRFMERGDLPIADDGSIVIYKVLNQSGDDKYVDCHSRKVTQRVGSFVCMDPKLVDHNRRNECSTGLHVARRGYIKSFSGDVCVLAKVAPEDVIAVPNYDANKMRVCGYHIIFQLDQDSYSKLKNNKPMTDNPKAQLLLGRAISGDHIGRIEEVRITGAYGSGVIITPLDGSGRTRVKGPAPKATAIDDVASAPSVDPKEVAKEVTATKTQAAQAKPATAGNSRQKLARALSDEGDIQGLIAFKKKSKVSWAALGFSEEEQQHILKMASMATAPKPVPTPAPKPATKPAPTVKAPAKKAKPAPAKKIVAIDPASPKGDKTAKVTVDTSKTPPVVTDVEIVEPKAKPGRPSIAHGDSRKAQMFELEKIYRDIKADPAHRAKAALELIDLRIRAKKSWIALGYPRLTDQILKSDAENFQRDVPKAAPTPAPKKGSVAIKGGSPLGEGTSAGQARGLFNAHDWTGLVTFKKSKKKSWAALGFTSKEESEIKLHIGD